MALATKCDFCGQYSDQNDSIDYKVLSVYSVSGARVETYDICSECLENLIHSKLQRMSNNTISDDI